MSSCSQPALVPGNKYVCLKKKLLQGPCFYHKNTMKGWGLGLHLSLFYGVRDQWVRQTFKWVSHGQLLSMVHPGYLECLYLIHADVVSKGALNHWRVVIDIQNGHL